MARLGVEAGCGLIEKEKFGAADDAERHIDAPPLPAGQGLDAGVRFRFEANSRDGLLDIAGGRVVTGEMAQLLAHRYVAALAARLQHDSEARLPFDATVLRIGTEHADLAAAAVAVPLEDLDRRRLPCAIRAEQGEGLAAVNVEAHAIERDRSAI